MTDTHRKNLISYLQDKKANRNERTTNHKEVKKSPSKGARRTMPTQRHVVHGKATIKDVPREILLYNIFPYLRPQDLTAVAQVCKEWHTLASDNYLWKPIFEKYGGPVKKGLKSEQTHGDGSPFKSSASNTMKESCMKRCVAQRNKRIFHKLKKQKNPYTGLPPSKDVHHALQEVGGVSWQLAFVDQSDNEHCITYQDATYHLLTVSLRWFELETLSLDQIKEIRIYSINPLFYDTEAKKFIDDGPYQRSLLLSLQINWRKWKRENKPVTGDDVINLYSLTDGVVLAAFKKEESIAFITVSFSLDAFIEKCLYGYSKSIYMPPFPEPLFDDFITNFGLINYEFTLQLRTMKQGVWDYKFRRLDCKNDFVDGFAKFECTSPGDQIFVVAKDFEFPWKTSLFKGKIPKAVWLDGIVTDDTRAVFWIVSSVLPITDKDTTEGHGFDMEYSGGTVQCIDYVSEEGKIHLELSRMEEGSYYLTDCVLLLSLESINKRFSTKYKDPKSTKR